MDFHMKYKKSLDLKKKDSLTSIVNIMVLDSTKPEFTIPEI